MENESQQIMLFSLIYYFEWKKQHQVKLLYTSFCLASMFIFYDTIDFLFFSPSPHSFNGNKNYSTTINLQIKCLYESSRLFVNINIRIYNYSNHEIFVYFTLFSAVGMCALCVLFSFYEHFSLL